MLDSEKELSMQVTYVVRKGSSATRAGDFRPSSLVVKTGIDDGAK